MDVLKAQKADLDPLQLPAMVVSRASRFRQLRGNAPLDICLPTKKLEESPSRPLYLAVLTRTFCMIYAEPVCDRGWNERVFTDIMDEEEVL